MLREMAGRTAIGLALAAGIGLFGRADAAQWPNITSDGPQWPNVSAAPVGTIETTAAKPNPRLEPRLAPRLPDVETTAASLDPPPSRPAPVFAPRPAPIRFVQKAEPAFSGELGIRYWFSWSQNSLDLYGFTRDDLVSRLTYDKMNGHNAEMFGRFEHNNGFYLKTILGGGWLINGSLTDEDFPPGTAPYSSTNSDQRGGTLAYGAIDFGYNIFERPAFRLGAFAGYHFLMERMSAFGCVQTAGNTAICGGGGVANAVEVITQNNTWQSLRVGLDAEWKLSKDLALSADAAYLPYVYLTGTDRHLLRIGTAPGDFTGAIPEDGRGWGYQLELALSYAVSENVKVAFGGRYWHMETKGYAHFENMVVGDPLARSQPLDWKTDHYGLFIQGSFKFGPYPTGTLY